jgi:hypothetical protein
VNGRTDSPNLVLCLHKREGTTASNACLLVTTHNADGRTSSRGKAVGRGSETGSRRLLGLTVSHVIVEAMVPETSSRLS